MSFVLTFGQASFWRKGFTALLVGLLSMPLWLLLFSWQKVDWPLWQHLWQTQLVGSVLQTFSVMGLSAFLATLLGVGAAFVLHFFTLPGARMLRVALVLPLAFPPYVLAYVYLGFGEAASEVPTLWQYLQLPAFSIRGSNSSMSAIMALALFPYPYLLAWQGFAAIPSNRFNAAQGLGRHGWQLIGAVLIPAIKPVLAVSLLIVAMEVVADFGVASMLGINTLTVLVYKTWFGYFDLLLASQLACCLLAMVAVLFFIKKRLNISATYLVAEQGQKSRFKLPCARWQGWGISFVLCGLWLLAFALPVCQMLLWWPWQLSDWHALLEAAKASIALAVLAAIFIVPLGLWLLSSKPNGWAQTWLSLGYACPGTLLAIGVLFTQQWFGVKHWPLSLLFIGLMSLLMAYSLRFFMVGFAPLSQAWSTLSENMHEQSRALGVSGVAKKRMLDLPVLSPAIGLAALVVWVEVMKEMPATLILRPLGWDTLAVQVYEFTTEGAWSQAAGPALLLGLLGVLPVFFLLKRASHKKL